MSNSILGPATLVFVGVVISAIGAFWASNQQRSAEQKLNQKNEEIAELSQFIANSVTGGDGFCYLRFSLPLNYDEPGTIIGIFNEGDYTLFDIIVRIVDLDTMDVIVASNKDKKYIGLDDWRKSEIEINVGNLPPKQDKIIASKKLFKKDEANYNIFISSRNGEYIQLERLKLIDGDWKRAHRVFKLVDKEKIILKEDVDKDFPKNGDGSVRWE
jgi:hypothetical protein